ncbi:MAG: hypothetical protein IPJ65_08565 [Archangiaceae bacterium]|nr:hypothetical protein [Archangiaceae bacterium]
MRGLGLLVSAAVACGGCGHSGRGWFRVDRQPAALAWQGSQACPAVEGPGPAVMLVPGIGGDTQNNDEVKAVLNGLQPAAMFTFRWSPMEDTRALLDRFSEGVEHLSACLPPRRQVVVLAHSAGGVLAALAAGDLELGQQARERELLLITVASPLAGHGYASWRTALLTHKPFVMTLGGNLTYARAPEGVKVFHLRTHAASDHVMRPTPGWHWPDHPDAVVPGATEHALPVQVGHDDALLWAARALVGTPERFGVTHTAVE